MLLGGVFVANMTGNTVLLGLAVAGAHGAAAITGTITTFIARAIDRILHRRRDPDQPDSIALPLGVWISYAAGALLGALIARWLGWPAFAVAATVVAGVAARKCDGFQGTRVRCEGGVNSNPNAGAAGSCG